MKSKNTFPQTNADILSCYYQILIIAYHRSGLELKVALWGQKARQFNINTINSETESAPIVILFVGCLMKIYQGTSI